MGQGGSCNCISKMHKPRLEVVESQPTLLTSEPTMAMPSAAKQQYYSSPSQCPTESSLSQCMEPGRTPPSRDQRCQSSSEYKYDMRQLLAMAEEEQKREQAIDNSAFALQQGQHQHQPAAALAQNPYQTSSSTRFQQIPNTVPLAIGVDRLDPVVVQQLLRNRQCILVDVRGDDRAVGMIEGAVHVPAVDAVPFSARLPECVRQWANQPVVIFHCQYSAHRAPQCANCYREQAPEHQRVAIMDGGFRGWESVGLPVQQGNLQQGVQGFGGQQLYNMYALQQGMQFALPAQQLARAN